MFIGAGLLIFGAALLYALMYFLLPNQKPVTDIISSSGLRISNIKNVMGHWDNVYASAYAMIEQIFNPSNFDDVACRVFVYISQT